MKKNAVGGKPWNDDLVMNVYGEVEKDFNKAAELCIKKCTGSCKSFNLKNGTNAGYVCEYSRSLVSAVTCKYHGTKTTYFSKKDYGTEYCYNEPTYKYESTFNCCTNPYDYYG